MKTVYKYELNYGPGITEIKMPYDAQVVKVGLDGHGNLCVWVLIDNTTALQDVRRFFAYFTGEEILGNLRLKYLDTVIFNEGRVKGFVVHVFAEV